MSTVTVRVIESKGGAARRAYGRWLAFSWIAAYSGKVIATGVDRATRQETLHDVNMLFGGLPNVDVVVVEEGAPDWPLRKAVTA